MSTSVLEMPSVQQSPAVAVRVASGSVTPLATTDNFLENVADQFTDNEVDSLHRDDAMAAGMIAVILGIAFSVLLVLVIGATVWTALFAG